jgi:ribosome-associated toxin RatA of RatAB toxin-antitoxin module
VDRIALSTVVYRPRDAVFDALLDFPRYPRYTEYLTDVTADGDGGVGTCYRLAFSWWRLSYTAHSEVTDVERPARVGWRITRHLDAEGHWATEPADTPGDAETATRVRFVAEFDPHSARTDAVSLPRFVSLDGVIDRLRPVLVEEAERVVERLVADIEGGRRDVDVTYHDLPGGG